MSSNIKVNIMKTLIVSDETYNFLEHWASVGRTIDAAVNSLLDLGVDHEQAQYTIGELEELKAALDDCGRAAKR